MKVIGLTAEPNLGGNQVDLSWTNPAEANFRGVKILRREGSYPELPGDLGSTFQIHQEPSAATPAGAPGRFSDSGLKSETVYYYAVVAYDDTLPVPRHSPIFVSCMSTGAYQSAGTMYKSLPALYQRFDLQKAPNAPGLDPADKDKGQLLRLMELVGPQVDLLRSYAKAAGDFSEVNKIDGALLPLLASWIGWDSGLNLSLAKQRNEVSYAPHFYRTTGIAGNLRATLNRVTAWDAKIKEFVHNVFLSNQPEQLTIWEIEQVEVKASKPQLVTLDMAYEGKPAMLQSQDGRQWLFYHCRQSVPTTQGLEEHFQIYYKVKDQGRWLPSRRLTDEGKVNKYPAVVQRPDGSFWLFWTAHDQVDGRTSPRIKTEIFSAGRDAQRPRRLGTLGGPFALVDGDVFRINITTGAGSIARTIPVHQEHFANIAQATAGEVAALLNRELPGVEVSLTKDGNLLVEATAAGSASVLTVTASPVGATLGLGAGATAGAAATSAQLLTRPQPFNLAVNDTLAIRVDSGTTTTVTFTAGDFANITLATAAEVAAAINRALPGLAEDAAGRVSLTSSTKGERSFVTVLLDDSSAVTKLGLGAPLPAAVPQPAADSEPTAFQDANNVWLFWSSRRSGAWNIWYNRFNGTNWNVAKQLTSGGEADREPSAVFDAAGRIWVFWSRRKINGLWNIFYRTTTQIDFNVLAEANWTQRELTPVPTNFENKEPAAVVTAANTVQLFFASGVTGGWHIRSSLITPASQAADQSVTSGQFSNRAPAVLRIGGFTQLCFRNNQSREYISPLYPAAHTLDARYGGSTTVDADNTEKLALRGEISDVQRYTYDTATTPEDWYARDALGIYLDADTNDPKVIEGTSLTIESVVKRFLPIQVRVVLIINSRAGFRFLRTWRAGLPTGSLPDLKVAPPDLSARLFLAGVTEGV